MKPRSVEKPAEKQKKTRIDWDAVKRDYRTDKLTLIQLGEKHGTNAATICRKIKKDQLIDPNDWPKDLTEAIRVATNAQLMTELVKDQVNEGQQKVNGTILAAAELNKQVILKHRKDIEATRSVAFGLLKEVEESALMVEEKELLTQILAGEGAEPKDEAQARQIVNKALNFGNRVSSVKLLADTFTKLQDSERKAFGLDDGDKKPPADDLPDDVLDRKLSEYLERASVGR